MRLHLVSLIAVVAALAFPQGQASAAATVAFNNVPVLVPNQCKSTPSYAVHTSGGTITDTVTCQSAPQQGHGFVCLPAMNEDKTGDLRTTVQIPSGFGLRTSGGEPLVQGGLRGIQQMYAFDKIAGASEPKTFTFGWTLVTVNSGNNVGLAHSTQCYEFANVNPNHFIGRFAVSAVTVPSNGALAFPFSLDANYPGTAVLGGFIINKEIGITAGTGNTVLDYGTTSGATTPLAHLDMLQTSPVKLVGDPIGPAATLASVPTGTTALTYALTINSAVPPASSGNFWTRRAMSSGAVQQGVCTNVTGLSTLSTAQIAAVAALGIKCSRGPYVGENTGNSANNAQLCNGITGWHEWLQLNNFFYGLQETDAVINADIARYPSGCINGFELSNENDYQQNAPSGDTVVPLLVNAPTLSLAGTTGGNLTGTRCYVATFTTYNGETSPSGESCITMGANTKVNATLTYNGGAVSSGGFGGRFYEGPSGGPYSNIAYGTCPTSGTCSLSDSGANSPDTSQQVFANTPNTSADFAGVLTRNGADWRALANSLGYFIYGETLVKYPASYTSVVQPITSTTITHANNHPYTYRRAPLRYDSPSSSHLSCGANGSFAFDPCANQQYVAPSSSTPRIITEVGSNTLAPQPGSGCISGTFVSNACGNPSGNPAVFSGLVHPYVQGAYLAHEIMVDLGLRRYSKFTMYSLWDVSANTDANAPNNYGQTMCADKLTYKPGGNFLKSFNGIIGDPNSAGSLDSLGYRVETTDGSAMPSRFISMLIQSPTRRTMYLLLVNAAELMDPNWGNLTFPATVPMKLTLQNAPQPSYSTRDEWQYNSGLPYIQNVTWNTASGDNSTTFNLGGDLTMFEIAPPAGAVQPASSSFSTPNTLPVATAPCP